MVRRRAPVPETELLLQAALRVSCRWLFLLQEMIVLCEETPDLVRRCQQLLPLFFVQGDRKTAQAVDRDTALLADTNEQLSPGLLQGLVLRAQPLQFRFQVLFSHSYSA